MAFFTKDLALPTLSELTPVSMDRIAAALDREEITYSIDSDGDLVAGWAQGVLFFSLSGEQHDLLRITGRWRVTLPEKEHLQLLHACNNYNLERIWPKVYVATHGDDLLAMGEYNLAMPAGMTDDQLDHIIRCAVATTLHFFEFLGETFPQEWEAVRTSIEED